MASGTTEQTQQVVDHGVIPELIKLLSSSSSKEVRTQAIWTLGNISGDGAVFRNLVLQGGAVAPLIKILEEAVSERAENTLKYGTWALSNFCRGKPSPPYEGIKDALPILAKVIMGQEDLEVLVDALWCLSYLSDSGKQEGIQGVIDTGVVPYVVQHMT